jgi:hypothetical protein
MIGTNGNDEITALGGYGFIFPFGGDEVIRGGASNDFTEDDAQGVVDADQVFGGKGQDVIDVSESSSDGPDAVDCGPGIDTVFFAVGPPAPPANGPARAADSAGIGRLFPADARRRAP